MGEKEKKDEEEKKNKVDGSVEESIIEVLAFSQENILRNWKSSFIPTSKTLSKLKNSKTLLKSPRWVEVKRQATTPFHFQLKEIAEQL